MRTYHHNVRQALGVILVAFLLTAMLTLAAKAASASQPVVPTIGIGDPYVYVVAPMTSHVDKTTVTRGFAVQPRTSTWLSCARGERPVGYDAIALAPTALTESSSVGFVHIYRTARDRYSADAGRTLGMLIMVTQTHERPALIANMANRRMEVEVICRRR